ncbi:MAG TPA: sigma-70 family RNA polymerase sigma factor [Thermoleophilaceae bacterium]|nr:sigma-70 family RNA polymerase sigma factor [Thermoleophilaceae bacterium]
MTPRALFHPARLARRPVLSTQSDERLVDLVRAGSDPAFETIVERYRRPLMRYVSRILPPERAEDVVQQSFVKAYEAMRRDAATLQLRPWLYRIAHNNALNALRDRGLRHAELDDRLDRVERPDQALERAQGLRELVVAVQALPERQREAILLRELEGRSYEEIAVALGVTDGAVRQLLNRARQSLRAAAAAVTPWPLLSRLAAGESAEPVAVRVGEAFGASAAGAVAAKVCATALVTGAVIGGAVVAPRGAEEPGTADAAAEEARTAEEARAGGADGDSGGDDDGAVSGMSGRRAHGDDTGSRRGGEGEDDGRSGRRGGDDGDRSGPGDGGDDSVDDSGPGGGDDTEDRSGSSATGSRGSSDSSGEVTDAGSTSGPGSGEVELTEEATDSSGSGSGAPELDDALEPDGANSGPG